MRSWDDSSTGTSQPEPGLTALQQNHSLNLGRGEDGILHLHKRRVLQLCNRTTPRTLSVAKTGSCISTRPTPTRRMRGWDLASPPDQLARRSVARAASPPVARAASCISTSHARLLLPTHAKKFVNLRMRILTITFSSCLMLKCRSPLPCALPLPNRRRGSQHSQQSAEASTKRSHTNLIASALRVLLSTNES